MAKRPKSPTEITAIRHKKEMRVTRVMRAEIDEDVWSLRTKC